MHKEPAAKEVFWLLWRPVLAVGCCFFVQVAIAFLFCNSPMSMLRRSAECPPWTILCSDTMCNRFGRWAHILLSLPEEHHDKPAFQRLYQYRGASPADRQAAV